MATKVVVETDNEGTDGQIVQKTGGTPHWADPPSGLPPLANVDGAVLRETEPGATVAFQRLTLDDIDPAFTITSFAGPTFAREVGSTLTYPSFTAAYNAALSALTVDDGAGALPIALAAENAFAYDGGASGLPARSYTQTTLNAVVSWTLHATKLAGPTKSAAVSTQWQPRAYYDVATDPGTYNAAFITGLASSFLDSSLATTLTWGSGGGTQFGFYAFPHGYGAPSSVVDVATNLNFPVTLVASSVSVTNAFGVVITYDLYRSTFPLAQSFTTRWS